MLLADAVLSGDIRAIARAASLIEAQSQAGRELGKRLFHATGRALIIGITGAPGAGKSTLVNGLIAAYRVACKSVGVIAVDPSSPFSRGALLGDRVRMLEHHSDPEVFIRSMATRGRLGGLASATMDLVLLLDASGRQVVLVETVGVGQDELDIAHLADVTIVVLAPGAGDDIQALKAGILEVADIIVINKAELAGADRLYEQIIESQTLLDPNNASCATVCKTSAISNTGVNLLVQHIEEHRHTATIETWSHRLRLKLRDDLLAHLPEDLLARHAKRVLEKMEDPDDAMMALKTELLAQRKNGN